MITVIKSDIPETIHRFGYSGARSWSPIQDDIYIPVSLLPPSTITLWGVDVNSPVFGIKPLAITTPGMEWRTAAGWCCVWAEYAEIRWLCGVCEVCCGAWWKKFCVCSDLMKSHGSTGGLCSREIGGM